MNCTATYIPYVETGKFSNLVMDYIQGDQALDPFYPHAFDLEGIKNAINAKQNFTNRPQLFSVLSEQYNAVHPEEAVELNLNKLLADNTFTVCTAHQPNLFTGPLFFVYKIAHAIQLAAQLTKQFPENQFVPIYYMGSEDADLDELGHIYAGEKKYSWETQQTGAVGRMLTDKNLVALIDELEAQFSVEKFGNDIIRKLRKAYTEGNSIQQSTFQLVHYLFSKYGLVILIPDNPELKKLFIPVLQKELTEQFSRGEVERTIAVFPEKYKVQAAGRDLNLFYLKDNIRERIISNEKGFSIPNTNLHFTINELLSELKANPERFSPNVILRPVFQETILPNVAFIGGGGEIAYWLELNNVFKSVHIPMPVLVLRNSFLFIGKKQQEILSRWNLKKEELFLPYAKIVQHLIEKESKHQLSLTDHKQQLEKIYASINKIAGKIDPTLQQHAAALNHRAVEKINALEKKMYRAEKKKFEAMERQLLKVQLQLFPQGNLQERSHNLIEYYSVFGDVFIQMVIEHSKNPLQQFCILKEA